MIYVLIFLTWAVSMVPIQWFGRCNAKTHKQKRNVIWYLWDTYAPKIEQDFNVKDIESYEQKWNTYYSLFNECRRVEYETHLNHLFWRKDIKEFIP
jgi:hypothetical protein